jgi:hypothetical protein
MQAIEIEAQIDENGEIHIKLPRPRPSGSARVIVLFDADEFDADAKARDEQAEPNDFAGIWADLPQADFDAFLRETEERRPGG